MFLMALSGAGYVYVRERVGPASLKPKALPLEAGSGPGLRFVMKYPCGF